jgi:heme exporter protein D
MPGLDQLSNYGPVWIVMGLLMLAIASLFVYIVRTHERMLATAIDKAKEIREDSQLERQECVANNRRIARGMKRLAVNQRETIHMTRDLAQTLSLMVQESKKKMESQRS